ncbi:MAG TPA: carboxypeptidase regulatory-like domain-containing protein [Bryobacteraceae bacterium]|jgi:hypothetical protein|nr:carboxypeptidase regulatory-like domain-containing protein [Bryobacteraceae bacterium]
MKTGACTFGRLVPMISFGAMLMLWLAQVASGASVVVTGKVLDENGAPVNQARVIVLPEGAASVPANPQNAATSDPAGVFHLEIPANGSYRIEAERDGYFVFTNPRVALDEETPLEIHMNHLRELAEAVDVHYSPPVIDPEQTSDTTRLNSQEILNIPYPSSQDYRSALPLMQGAIQDNSGQIHFNGGNTGQTNYRLNGFEVSDPATGALTARLNVDTVQTLEWDSSRFSAAEGKGSAGVLDIKTEMGDDHWRFGGTNFIPGFGSQDGLHLNHWSPRVKLSGPLMKSRLWLSTAVDAYYVVNTVTGLPKGQDQATSSTGSNLTRLQWNITGSQILTASFLGNLSDNNRTGLSVLSPAETTVNIRQSIFMGTLKDQWMVGGGLVELGFADSRTYLRSSPQGNAAYVVTPFGATGNFFTDQTRNTGRQEWFANGFVAPLHGPGWLKGTHQIQIGTDVEHSDLDQNILRNEYTSVRVDNSIVRDVQFLGSPQQFKNKVEAYGYVLDRWVPFDGLLLEGGFRTQWDQYTGGAPFAPRLSAAWSPKWAGGTKFAAGWGVFYDAVTLGMLALSQEQDSISTFYGPTGAITAGPINTHFVLKPGDLRLPRFAISSFSAERKLPFQLYGKLNLISREGSRGFTFQDIVQSPSLNLYVLDNIQRQRYRAASFALRRTFLSKYQWFASYTRSESRANAVINYAIENPIFAPQSGGPLPWDAPNRVLAWGWAPVEKTWFPHFMSRLIGDTDAQLLFDYRTGFPFTVTNEAGEIVGAPNSMRFPDYATVDVALERKFPFRGYLWAWRVGLINSLNRANPNVVNSDIDSPQYLAFARGQSRAVNVRLRFLGRK